MLASAWTPESLRKVLISRAQWRPFPTAADRDGWSAVPDGMFESVLSSATERMGKPYPPLPATLYLEYVRNGNRSHFEAATQARRRQLVEAVLAECAEGKGRFNDAIADGVWTICEESTWVYPAHLSAQKRGSGLADPNEYVIDLFSAETGAMLAWIDYLVGPNLEKVNPMVRDRLHEYGFDYLSIFAIGWRDLHHVVELLFDRRDPAIKKKAEDVFRVLVHEAAAAGYGEYRTHLSFMDDIAKTYGWNDHALLKLHQTIKDALDPNGILAPGKSGIWPARYRGSHT